MRRILVASVVLFIAACGGGVPAAAQRNAIPTDGESALLIESLTQRFGSDAVDACLAAWQDALLADDNGPVSKPGAAFRRFVSRCARGEVPPVLRSAVDSLRDPMRSNFDQ